MPNQKPIIGLIEMPTNGTGKAPIAGAMAVPAI